MLRSIEDVREFTDNLACALSDEEMIAKAKEADSLAEQADLIETRGKAQHDAAKDRAKGMRRDVRELLHLVGRGYEYRDVDCKQHYDREVDSVLTIRLDTGEVIDRRPLEDEERQSSLIPRNAVDDGDPNGQDEIDRRPAGAEA